MAVAAAGQREALQPLMDDYKVNVADTKESFQFDNLDAPPPVPTVSSWSWKRWRGRIISVVVGVGAIALRASQISRVANALGSFGAGAAIQSAIQSGFKGATSARIRQVGLTLLGQGALFAFSQGFQNTTETTWKTYLVHAIIAQLGANLAIAARWLYQKRGALRVESHAPESVGGETLKYTQLLSHNKSHIAKVVVAAVCAAGYFYVEDPLIKGGLSFVASFFPSQVLGERTIDALDAPRFLKRKTALITLAYVLQPLGFIPWANPSTEERIKQLVFVGIGLGFVNGVADQSKIPRFQRIPIEDLEELQRLKPPEKPAKKGCTCPTLRYLAYRTFTLAAPLMALGVLGFGIWQEVDDLKTTDQRAALGAMVGGFLVTYPAFRKLDSGWDPQKATRLKNSMMVSLWSSSRVLGFPLVMVYFAGINSLKMDGDALSTPQSPYHLAVLISSLFSYGAMFGKELAVMESDRIGSPQLKAPELFYINSVTTTYFSIIGKVP